MTERRYTLTYPKRPWSLNAERSAHWANHRSMTAEWREAFAWLALWAKVPPLGRIDVRAQPGQKGGVLADTGNCYGAVKAAIDGLVDARVIPDDGPRYVASITLLAPILGGDLLTLTITESPT